jgi:hypothetical protein
MLAVWEGRAGEGAFCATDGGGTSTLAGVFMIGTHFRSSVSKLVVDSSIPQETRHWSGGRSQGGAVSVNT